MTAPRFTESFIGDVKAKTDLAEVVGRSVALKRSGGDLWGLCPFHTEKTPSFKVDRSGGFFKCFGCGERGDVIDYVAQAYDLSFAEAVEHLAIEAGLLADREGRKRPQQPKRARAANRRDSDKTRIRRARSIWRAATPAPGTLVDLYLQSRAITLPPPPTLRFAPNLWHDLQRVRCPAMIAAVAAGPDRKVCAVHRTYLLPNGAGKARLEPPKLACGVIGAGAVRLGPAAPALGLAEGIETALSAMQLFDIPVWAALGSRLDSVSLPPEVVEVQLFADNGGPGHEAAEKAADAFTSQGRRVAIRYPPGTLQDWNDALQALTQEQAA